MKKNNFKAMRATLLMLVMLVGAVAALYRVPVASASPVIELVPGDPIPEVTEPEIVPETTEPETEPTEPYRPQPTEPTPETQHVHTANVDRRDATCTEAGYVHEFCTSCNETLSYTEIPAMGHEYHETSRVDPQVGVPGYIEYTCVRNDDSYRTPLEALPEPETQPEEHVHTVVHTNQPATCTKDGYSRNECMECGAVLEETVIPAHGHPSYVETARVAPQVGVDGYVIYTCVHGDHSYTEILPALPVPETTPTEPVEPEEPEYEQGCEDVIF